jgi:hypothetical protein
VHSGYGAEWGQTDANGVSYLDRIWSHQSPLYSGSWLSGEGIRVQDYTVCARGTLWRFLDKLNAVRQAGFSCVHISLCSDCHVLVGHLWHLHDTHRRPGARNVPHVRPTGPVRQGRIRQWSSLGARRIRPHVAAGMHTISPHPPPTSPCPPLHADPLYNCSRLKPNGYLLQLQWGFDSSQNYPPMLSAWNRLRLNVARVVDVSTSSIITVNRYAARCTTPT